MKKKHRLAVYLAIVLAIVAVVALVAFAADDTENGLSSWRVTVTTVVAGLVGVPLTQLIKKILPESMGKALMTYIAYAAAFIVALIAYAMTGGLSTLLASPLSVLASGSTVFAIMTVAYNSIKERLNMGRS